MDYNFVKVGAVSPKIQVADVNFNVNSIKKAITIAKNTGVDLLVLPELSLSGATCGDLFFNKTLIKGCENGLREISLFCQDYDGLVLIGLPIVYQSGLYNVCAVINKGKIIGIVPKTNISCQSDLNAKRFLNLNSSAYINLFGEQIPFDKDFVFCDSENKDFTLSVTFADQIINGNVQTHGANVVACLSSMPMLVGKVESLQTILSAQSSVNSCAIIYCESGEGESTSNMVYGGVNAIIEKGEVLSISQPFSSEIIINDVDIDYIAYKKIKTDNMQNCMPQKIFFTTDNAKQTLIRKYKQLPFVPETNLQERANLILDIQAEGLKKRISHTNAKSVVLGLSGGLDSTLAIIVAVRAIKKLGRSTKDVVAVTMPCFGTTSRTLNNSIKLAKALGATLKKVDISKSVTRHLKDIKHNGIQDVTFENAQARERTQVLMDIANMDNGLVVGTGDLSELALGWATYNGDHMSMYSVNGSLPKTLIRHVVEQFALKSKAKVRNVLLDILDTPVSPELLPAKDGEITQKTEDLVGPYILHDFFLYHIVGRGISPRKLYFIANQTFKGSFDEKTILKWLKTFIRRFFTQQFKRSCQPDGIKVGKVSLNAKIDFDMPSDAVSSLWLQELENL